MTSRRGTKVDIPSTDGRPPVLRLEPHGRRVQIPQLVVALLLMGVGALGSVVLFSQASARQPVLAVAAPLARGEVVAAEDLRVAYVGSDDPMLTVSPDQLSSLVGLVALTDLEAGTIIVPGFFAARVEVDAGEGVVGLSLGPGAYPSVHLSPGDVVDVVDSDSPDGVVARGAVVFDVAELGVQGQRLVSLLLDSETAAAVARVPEDRLRLVLVAGAGP